MKNSHQIEDKFPCFMYVFKKSCNVSMRYQTQYQQYQITPTVFVFTAVS